MAELSNTFSWSFSAAEDFDICRRKRYWAKYAMWGGWESEATPLQKDAYRLSKMDNAWSVLGRAVEEAVMWSIRRAQAGLNPTPEEAYEAAARPYLNRAWTDSRRKRYLENPKRFIALREHYYGDWTPEREQEIIEALKVQSRRCLDQFHQTVLPRLRTVRPEDELRIAIIGSGGEPESFEFDAIKVYAIPDYAYRAGQRLHIHDWKAGRIRESHEEQLTLYGLWALVKHGFPPEQVDIFIEYLAEGVTRHLTLTADDLERIKERIRLSVEEMADYLVDRDIKRNEPLPQAEWELSQDLSLCRRCNFLELCQKDPDYPPAGAS